MRYTALDKSIFLKNSASDQSKNRVSVYTQLGDINIRFDSPYLELEQYSRALRYSCQKINMSDRYYMRPDYVAYDYLGSTNLSYLILYLNKCRSCVEFTMDEILVPSRGKVSEFLSKVKRNINKKGERYVLLSS